LDHFGISWLVLVGDRGMITSARIRDDIEIRALGERVEEMVMTL